MKVLALLLLVAQAYGSDELSWVSQMPGIRETLKECEEGRPNDQDLGQCLWGKLTEDEKAQVVAKLEEMGGGADQDSPDGAQYDALDVSWIQRHVSPADRAYFQKLQEALAQKLNVALYGDGDDEKISMVDHFDFHRIYRTRMGKNLMESISTFCMQTSFDSAQSGRFFQLVEEDKREEEIKKWVEKLKDPPPQPQGTDLGNSGVPSPFTLWSLCMKHIQYICTDKHPDKPNDSSKKYCELDTSTPKTCNLEESQAKACIVSHQMAKTRQSLLFVEGIIRASQEHTTNQGKHVQGDHPNEIRHYESRGDDSINKMTTLTSQEFQENTASQEENKEAVEKCFKDGQIINTGECERFLHTNRIEQEDHLTEDLLLHQAMLQRIKEADREEIEKLLKEQGHSDEEVQKLVQENLEQVKNAIVGRFQSEMENIHTSLRESIKSRTSDEEGRIQASNAEDNLDRKALQRITDEFTARPERMRNILRFTNIVSGFLEIRSEDGPNIRNFAGLESELETLGPDDPMSQNIRDSIRGLRGDAPVNDEGGENATLSSETIRSQLLTLPVPDQQ